MIQSFFVTLKKIKFIGHAEPAVKVPEQKVSEYDQEKPQSHNTDQPSTPRGRATEHL